MKHVWSTTSPPKLWTWTAQKAVLSKSGPRMHHWKGATELVSGGIGRVLAGDDDDAAGSEFCFRELLLLSMLIRPLSASLPLRVCKSEYNSVSSCHLHLSSFPFFFPALFYYMASQPEISKFQDGSFTIVRDKTREINT